VRRKTKDSVEVRLLRRKDIFVCHKKNAPPPPPRGRGAREGGGEKRNATKNTSFSHGQGEGWTRPSKGKISSASCEKKGTREKRKGTEPAPRKTEDTCQEASSKEALLVSKDAIRGGMGGKGTLVSSSQGDRGRVPFIVQKKEKKVLFQGKRERQKKSSVCSDCRAAKGKKPALQIGKKEGKYGTEKGRWKKCGKRGIHLIPLARKGKRPRGRGEIIRISRGGEVPEEGGGLAPPISHRFD